jgi:hypothetical protein
MKKAYKIVVETLEGTRIFKMCKYKWENNLRIHFKKCAVVWNDFTVLW